MALTIVSSNRVETLQSRLAQDLARAPLAQAFASEIIVVPTFAMARWLNLRFAQQQGIAANFHYPQVAQWIWQLAGRAMQDLPARDPYAREALAWHIFALLPEMLERPDFSDLNHYLADDRNGIKRWQLSQRLGDSFDRYQSYRPQVIREWSDGGDDRWQASYIPLSMERQPFLIGFQDRDVDGVPQRVPVVHVDMDHPHCC